MPLKIVELDSSSKQEDSTLLVGKNILLKILELPKTTKITSNSTFKKFVSIKNLCHKDINESRIQLFRIESLMNELLKIKIEKTFESLQNDEFMKKLTLLQEFSTDMIKITSQILPLDIEKIVEQALEKELEKLDGKQFTPDEVEAIHTKLRDVFFGHINQDQIVALDSKLMQEAKELLKKTEVDFLTQSKLIICPYCKLLLSKQEFEDCQKCKYCARTLES